MTAKSSGMLCNTTERGTISSTAVSFFSNLILEHPARLFSCARLKYCWIACAEGLNENLHNHLAFKLAAWPILQYQRAVLLVEPRSFPKYLRCRYFRAPVTVWFRSGSGLHAFRVGESTEMVSRWAKADSLDLSTLRPKRFIHGR